MTYKAKDNLYMRSKFLKNLNIALILVVRNLKVLQFMPYFDIIYKLI